MLRRKRCTRLRIYGRHDGLFKKVSLDNRSSSPKSDVLHGSRSHRLQRRRLYYQQALQLDMKLQQKAARQMIGL
jgi:hypothetical protein